MVRRIREHDWAETSLGPIEDWPDRLKGAVDLVLASNQAMFVAAGRELLLIYNDGYIVFLPGKHPQALGSPFRKTFSEIVDAMEPMLERTLAGQQEVMLDVHFIMPWRSEQPDGWFTATWTPMRDNAGAISGFIAAIAETTDRARAQAVLRENERKLHQNEARLAAQNDAFRAAMNGEPLNVSLGILIRTIVAQADGSPRCAFYIRNENGGLRHVVGMSDVYAEQVDDFKISPESLACGLAVATGEPVITPDVLEEPRWRPWTWLAREHGFRGCWSFPVETASGKLVGSFAMYFSEPRKPSKRDLELAAGLTQAAAILISRDQESGERAHAESALRESEHRLRIALEAGRMGIWSFDLRTGEQEWSDGQFEIFGLTPGNPPPTREEFLKLVHPEDVHLVEFSDNDTRPEGTSLDSEFRIVRPGGEVRTVAAHSIARFGADGRPVELIGVNYDVTDRRSQEEALRRVEERLREFGEASSDVLWIRDAETLQWEYLSPAFEKIYGISRQDALRGNNFHSWQDFILPEDRENAFSAIKRVREGKRAAFEFRIRRPNDGQIRWLRNTDFPMRNAQGKVERIGGVGHDITALKAADEHQKFLAAELQHRVRNTLGVVRSIARRTADTSHTVEGYATHLDGRLNAFARVQAAMTNNPGAGLNLETMILDELAAHAAREGEQVHVEGPPVRLAMKAAETLGLAFHEMATNAVKHGALVTALGRVRVVWRIENVGVVPHLIIAWKESGPPVPPGEPRRRGFGTELLERTLAYELKADVNLLFEPDGLFITILLPISDRLTIGRMQ
jgi:PAS domain S-box-containing protein